MRGMKSLERKQRREARRRNYIARDLRTPKYGPRIRETNRHHLIDEQHDKDAQEELYEFFKDQGLTTKE